MQTEVKDHKRKYLLQSYKLGGIKNRFCNETEKTGSSFRSQMSVCAYSLIQQNPSEYWAGSFSESVYLKLH